jgi:hypothetical protein
MRSPKKSFAVVPLALTLALTSVSVAGAGDGDVEVRGRCSGGSEAELKLSDEDGRIEVEFEVDQNRVGQRWRVVVRDDGARVLRTRATTTAPSGSFEVRTLVADSPGRDVIRARARNLSTGEVCRAVARW